MAERIKGKLKKFIQENNLKEKDYLFQGQKGHLTTRTVQTIIKQTKKKANLKKRIHPHILRHSFATHLIDERNDLLSVQSLLGHKSPETTILCTLNCQTENKKSL